jgi:hypothetical protein
MPRGPRAGAALLVGIAMLACSSGTGEKQASSGALDPFATTGGSGAVAASTASPGTLVELRAGQCFDVDQFQSGVPIDRRGVHLALCAGPHEHEVIATFTYPDPPRADWPGPAVLDEWASDHCVDAFATYVGIEYERSHLDVASVHPDERSWKDGDRAVACAAHDVDFALLVGSVKGTAK